MKIFSVPVLLLLGLALTLNCIGCTTANNTTSSAGAISGTITLPGVAGVLWIGATTVNDFTATSGWIETKVQVSASDTTYSYSLPISTPGTYYVVATLSVGTTEPNVPTPAAGDRLGGYAGGGMPSVWNQTPVGTPTPIDIASGASATGKDFDLKVTWVSTVATAGTISGTITLPGLAGNLWVGATTDNTFTATTGWQEVYKQVTAADATYNYSIPISTPGTYYILAALSVGTTESRCPTPAAGDRLGEYDRSEEHTSELQSPHDT
jgi:hypothetical protein